jgi:hypothetical protein
MMRYREAPNKTVRLERCEVERIRLMLRFAGYASYPRHERI